MNADVTPTLQIVVTASGPQLDIHGNTSDNPCLLSPLTPADTLPPPSLQGVVAHDSSYSSLHIPVGPPKNRQRAVSDAPRPSAPRLSWLGFLRKKAPSNIDLRAKAASANDVRAKSASRSTDLVRATTDTPDEWRRFPESKPKPTRDPEKPVKPVKYEKYLNQFFSSHHDSEIAI